MFLSFESSNTRKISLEEGGNQDPGDPGVGKIRGEGFFFLQAGGELTLDDTMVCPIMFPDSVIAKAVEAFSYVYPLCSCSLEAESTAHFFLCCQNYNPHE